MKLKALTLALFLGAASSALFAGEIRLVGAYVYGKNALQMYGSNAPKVAVYVDGEFVHDDFVGAPATLTLKPSYKPAEPLYLTAGTHKLRVCQYKGYNCGDRVVTVPESGDVEVGYIFHFPVQKTVELARVQNMSIQQTTTGGKESWIEVLSPKGTEKLQSLIQEHQNKRAEPAPRKKQAGSSFE